jgi:ribosomal protein L32
MAHEVFICYASQDELVAKAVCNALEANQIKCWIAPRDVLPGAEWAETIVDALDESRVLVLVLSSNSNTSPHVVREVGRAVDNSIPIIPLRIENVTPSKAMTFFISRHQWLDAQAEPLEKHLKRLTDTVQQILARKLTPQEAIEVAETKEKAKKEAAKAVQKVSCCLKCGVELRPNAIFCHKCGTRVGESEKTEKAEKKAKGKATKAVQEVSLCPKCGVKLRPNAIFCHNCGARVSKG